MTNQERIDKELINFEDYIIDKNTYQFIIMDKPTKTEEYYMDSINKKMGKYSNWCDVFLNIDEDGVEVVLYVFEKVKWPKNAIKKMAPKEIRDMPEIEFMNRMDLNELQDSFYDDLVFEILFQLENWMMLEFDFKKLKKKE